MQTPRCVLTALFAIGLFAALPAHAQEGGGPSADKQERMKKMCEADPAKCEAMKKRMEEMKAACADPSSAACEEMKAKMQQMKGGAGRAGRGEQ